MTPMKNEEQYVRGAFVVFPPGGKSAEGRLIPFRFNPEGLSRSLQIEQAPNTPGNEGAETRRGQSGAPSAPQASDAAEGALKQTFSVMLRFDLRDREEGQPAEDAASRKETLSLGVLPELAALEELMYPTPGEQKDTSEDATAPRAPRSTVLLVWGVHRVFPVRVVSMTINETLHNAELAPVRAEVEVGLEVARDDASGDSNVAGALTYMRSQRSQHAQRFYGNKSAQGTSYASLDADTQKSLWRS